MIYATVSGGDKIIKMLRKMDAAGRRVFKSTVRAAVAAEARAMRATARAAAPKRTGRLRRAIVTVLRTVKGSITGRMKINLGDSREDTRGAWYGPAVNSGFTVGKRYVAGAHFMEKAHDRHADEAKKKVAAAITDGIDAAMKAS
jgi:HK97 gp10 family phage protein